MANNYVQVPPDSTGKKLFTQQHVVESNTVQVQVSHIADEKNPEQILSVDRQGAASIRFSEGQPTLTGFGSLNVSQATPLGVYESSSGSYDALFSVEEVTGGTNVYDDTGHGMLLLVTGSSGSEVKRTTNRYHYYLPGSSNIVLMTIACGDTGKTGNLRRWGAFDDTDGIYFELYESTVNAVIRSSTTGSVVETKVPQASWNGDKLNGTGLSEVSLTLTNINVWWMDYQWLGAGRVRFGIFGPDGSRITCHTFQNAGANTLPYMRTGTLPLTTQNLNFSATGSSSQLRETCMAVYSEGRYADYAFWRSSDINATATATASDTLLVALRSKTNAPGLNHHNSIIAYPETLNVYSDQPVRIDITQGVTATGGTWTLGTADVSIEGSTDTAVTGLGSPFKTLFFGTGASTFNLSDFFEINDEGIMLNADGTKEVWAITARKLGATNAQVTINLGYKELW